MRREFRIGLILIGERRANTQSRRLSESRCLETIMNRYVSPQMMTIEEAKALSDPHTSRDANEERRRIWAWQTVAGAMSMTIDDEQLDKMAALRLKRK
jgi:hypothetical protein